MINRKESVSSFSRVFSCLVKPGRGGAMVAMEAKVEVTSRSRSQDLSCLHAMGGMNESDFPEIGPADLDNPADEKRILQILLQN